MCASIQKVGGTFHDVVIPVMNKNGRVAIIDNNYARVQPEKS